VFSEGVDAFDVRRGGGDAFSRGVPDNRVFWTMAILRGTFVMVAADNTDISGV
jgi:hypothetical protein